MESKGIEPIVDGIPKNVVCYSSAVRRLLEYIEIIRELMLQDLRDVNNKRSSQFLSIIK